MKKIVYFIYDILVSNIVKAIGIVMVISVLTQIFARSFMKMPFPWTEEFARITFVWFCFLGSCITLKNNSHLCIDFFYLKFGRKTKRFIDIFVILTIISFGLLLTYYGYKLTILTSVQKSPVLRVPMSYFYVVMPITGILYTILGIYQLSEKFIKSKINMSIN